MAEPNRPVRETGGPEATAPDSTFAGGAPAGEADPLASTQADRWRGDDCAGTVDPSGATVFAGGPAGATVSTSVPIPAVPGYEILGELGRGSMGVVYLGRNLRLNRPCAVKMILAGAFSNPLAAERFRTEAELAARLQHANVVQIRHFGEAAGLPFLELEYLPGGGLERRLDGTPWDASRAAALMEPLARAVAAAHRSGVVHRDLKPSNILLGGDGTPKVGDFGLAKSLEGGSNLTATESVLGTPGYMAPEQAEGRSKEIGPAADIYSLGAIFYELLTGRPPFRGATVLDILRQVTSAEPVSPTRLVAGIPRDAETIAMKCLRKEPNRRYESAEALADDLLRFREGKAVLAMPTGPVRRAWLWGRRNRGVAALGGAAALLLVLLATGSTVAALRFRADRQELRDEQRRADAAETMRRLDLVDSVLTAAPDGVPYLLASLGPVRLQATPLLRRALADPAASSSRRLRAAEALTILGDPQVEAIFDGLATAPGGEGHNLLAALKALGEPAVAELRRRAGAAPDAEARARPAIAALLLGDPGLAKPMLAFGPDPVERIAFLRAFKAWDGDLSALPGLLRRDPDPAFRSGLCGALAGLDPASMTTAEREGLTALFLEFHRSDPAAATHAAAGYALRAWGGTLPAPARSGGPVAGRGWFVNRSGLTMVEIPPAAFPTGKFRNGLPSIEVVSHGFHLADREVWIDLFRAFLDDPDTPATAKPTDWPGPRPGFSGDSPVTDVTPVAAALFCNWLSRREGRESCYRFDPGAPGGWADVADADGYRLPTRTEFQLAYSDGTITRIPVGQDAEALAERGIIGEFRPRPGASRHPDGYGLFDMIGNVWEYCLADSPGGPLVPSIRGAAFDSGSFDTLSESNHVVGLDGRSYSIGFRVACGPRGAEGRGAGDEELLADLARRLRARPVRDDLRPTVLRLEASIAITRDRWEDLAGIERRLAEGAPEDHWNYWQGAIAALRAGRIDEYRWFCREMLRRFEGAASWDVCERTAIIHLLDTRRPESPGRIADLARRVLRLAPDNPWALTLAGLSEYRSGRHRVALRRLEEAADRMPPEDDNEFAEPLRRKTLIVQALALARLARWDEARRCLDRAEAIHADRLPGDRRDGSYLDNWRDWLQGDILRDEAGALMLDRHFPADPFAH